jgi:hypothetical protein
VRITDHDRTPEEKILEQLPEPAPPVPFDMGVDFPDIDDAPTYSTEPVNLRTIALLKTKYRDKAHAKLRARELCLATGERIYRFFETGRAYVAQVYVPMSAPKGF